MRIVIIEILIVREGNIGNCHPEKTTDDRSKPEVVSCLFPMLSSRAVNNYFILLNVNQILRLHYVWFRKNPGQVNICAWISYSVYSNAQLTPVQKLRWTVRASTLHSRYFFLNITRCQAISLVVKQYHSLSSNITRCKTHRVLGRGLM